MHEKKQLLGDTRQEVQAAPESDEEPAEAP